MSKANNDPTAPGAGPANTDPVTTLTAAGRPAIEALVELLVLLLDRGEGDTDVEASLAGSDTDLEEEKSDFEPNVDDEPSLGASEPYRYTGQQDWSRGCGNDLEPTLTTCEVATGDPSSGWNTPDEAERVGYNPAADIEARRKRSGIKPRAKRLREFVGIDPQGRPGTWKRVPQGGAS